MVLLRRIRPAIERFWSRHASFHSGKGSNDATDLHDVAYSAALLQVSEFRLFHLAHVHWFGYALNDRNMERIFVSYMFDNVIPHWVRHLARTIMYLNEQGTLDPADFNIKRRKITPEMRAQGEWYIIVILIIVVLFCALLAGHVPPQ